MGILAVIGIILLVVMLFVCGGLLGWLFKVIEIVFDFLLSGWSSCMRVIIWIILIVLLLMIVF